MPTLVCVLNLKFPGLQARDPDFFFFPEILISWGPGNLLVQAAQEILMQGFLRTLRNIPVVHNGAYFWTVIVQFSKNKKVQPVTSCVMLDSYLTCVPTFFFYK